eukprot:scaffold1528_cov117-Isochrysis_galbana.AAC.5
MRPVQLVAESNGPPRTLPEKSLGMPVARSSLGRPPPPSFLLSTLSALPCAVIENAVNDRKTCKRDSKEHGQGSRIKDHEGSEALGYRHRWRCG